MRSTQNVNQATSVYVEALAELSQTAIQTRPLGMQALDFSKQNLELIRGSGHVEEWLRHVFPGDSPIETKEGIQQLVDLLFSCYRRNTSALYTAHMAWEIKCAVLTSLLSETGTLDLSMTLQDAISAAAGNPTYAKVEEVLHGKIETIGRKLVELLGGYEPSIKLQWVAHLDPSGQGRLTQATIMRLMLYENAAMFAHLATDPDMITTLIQHTVKPIVEQALSQLNDQQRQSAETICRQLDAMCNELETGQKDTMLSKLTFPVAMGSPFIPPSRRSGVSPTKQRHSVKPGSAPVTLSGSGTYTAAAKPIGANKKSKDNCCC